MSRSFFDYVQSQDNVWMIQIFIVILITTAIGIGTRWLLKRMKIGMKKKRSIWNDAAIAAAGRPLLVLVWVLGLNIAGIIIADHTGSAVFRYASEARSLAFITLLAWFLVRFVRIVEEDMLSTPRPRHKLDATSTRAIAKLARISVVVTASLILLERLGYSVSGVMAFGGIGGIAVGFAARDMLSNFFGGLMLFLDRPFNIGDWIRSPDRNIEGIVEQIGWRQTCIRTFDKRPLYIPNSTFSSIAVENPSRMTYRCIKETVGLRYKDKGKLPFILEKINTMLANHEGLTRSEAAGANLDKLNVSSLDLTITAFTPVCSVAEYTRIKEDILLKTLKIIDDEGAEPFLPSPPQ
jgi:MscS family membrane protein